MSGLFWFMVGLVVGMTAQRIAHALIASGKAEGEKYRHKDESHQ